MTRPIDQRPGKAWRTKKHIEHPECRGRLCEGCHERSATRVLSGERESLALCSHCFVLLCRNGAGIYGAKDEQRKNRSAAV